MSNTKKVLLPLLVFIFLCGCSNELPSNVFLTDPSNQKINNLFDYTGDKKSDLIFWVPNPSNKAIKKSYFIVKSLFGKSKKLDLENSLIFLYMDTFMMMDY